MIARILASAAGTLAATGTAGAMAFGVSGGAGVLTGGADVRAQTADAGQDGTLRLDTTDPLFLAAGLVPGDVLERCVVLTNTSGQAVDVALYGARPTTGLAAHLRLTITRGTRGQAAAGSCAGFVPATADFGQGVPGVQFQGTLTSFPSTVETAITSDDVLPAGGEGAYRLRIEVTGGNEAQSLTATQTFSFAATARRTEDTSTPTPPDKVPRKPRRQNPNEPAASAERACSRVDVPAIQAAGLRRIPGTERWVVPRRVLAPFTTDDGDARKLGLRIWTNQWGQKLVFALGERWAMGVAPAGEWGRVAYRLNNERAGEGTDRPYVWQVGADQIYPGENRVRVVVQTARGPVFRGEFRFRMKAWGENPDESVCTLA